MNKNRKILLTGLLFLGALILIYSNHFNNGFYFDDSHTIVNNEYIRDIGNIPKFFASAETMSTLPTNRSYRPVVAVMNTIDHHIAGGLDPFYFHLSIFFWYIVQCILLYFFFKKILNLSLQHRWNGFIALFITAWYAFHTANAETINYIISRSDSFSTLCIVASFMLYLNAKTRKLHLYLLTFVVALLTKQSGLMFVPLLFVYIMLFEEKLSVKDLLTLKNKPAIGNLLKKVAPAAILGVSLFLFIQQVMSQGAGGNLFVQEASRWKYFITQQYVMLHYLGNFLIPLNLSADSTVSIIPTIVDQRVIYGFLCNVGLLTVASILSGKNKYRPVAFGIFWFYIALFPTSSFHPLSQVSNDHRVFFPYIGLILAAGWMVGLLIIKNENILNNNKLLRAGLPVLVSLFIFGYGYGAYQRNIVWSSSESLWKDAAIKGPGNGRALMNYGLTQMQKGKYDVALEYFEKAEKLMPYWCYIHINMGILKNSMGKPAEAEAYYKRAIRVQSFNPEGYYYYARWLHKQGRTTEAIAQLEIAKAKSPGYTRATQLLAQLKNKGGSNGKPNTVEKLKQSIAEEPTTDKYIDLSLLYYRQDSMKACIRACEEALKIDPRISQAYNNICSAYNRLQEWDKAIEACNKALAINPDFQRAKNNLNWALIQKKKK